MVLRVVRKIIGDVGKPAAAGKLPAAVREVLAALGRSGILHGDGGGVEAAWCRLICRFFAIVVTGVFLWYGGGCVAGAEARETRGYHRVFTIFEKTHAPLLGKHNGAVQRNAHADLRQAVSTRHKHLQTASVGVLSANAEVWLHEAGRLVFLVSGVSESGRVALPRIHDVPRTASRRGVAMALGHGWTFRREGRHAHRKDAFQGYFLCHEVRGEGKPEKSARRSNKYRTLVGNRRFEARSSGDGSCHSQFRTFEGNSAVCGPFCVCGVHSGRPTGVRSAKMVQGDACRTFGSA